VALYVVRHAKAGERRGWNDDDLLRPLSTAGWKQARLLADRLAGVAPTTLVSSPYVRCVQTLEPLAERLGIDVGVDERITEGVEFTDSLELLDEVPDGSVLCSHGDVIPALLDALLRRGLEVRSTPDWRKASTWVIKRKKSGHYTTARVWPPPGR
jgi:8-oxo-dGTP diphosphatase